MIFTRRGQLGEKFKMMYTPAKHPESINNKLINLTSRKERSIRSQVYNHIIQLMGRCNPREISIIQGYINSQVYNHKIQLIMDRRNPREISIIQGYKNPQVYNHIVQLMRRRNPREISIIQGYINSQVYNHIVQLMGRCNPRKNQYYSGVHKLPGLQPYNPTHKTQPWRNQYYSRVHKLLGLQPYSTTHGQMQSLRKQSNIFRRKQSLFSRTLPLNFVFIIYTLYSIDRENYPIFFNDIQGKMKI